MSNIDEAVQIAKQALRDHRDAQLSATDWAVLPDSSITEIARREYAEYRAWLRDLPDTTTDEEVMRFSGIMSFDDWRATFISGAQVKSKYVQAEMARRMSLLAEGYEETERETWPTQVDEAKAIKAGGTTAPLLQRLADAKGRTLTEQADRVLSLSAAFAAASGGIMAARDILLQADPIPDDYQDDKHWS